MTHPYSFIRLIGRLVTDIAELILFGMGISMLIPPVPSEPTTQVHFFPNGIFAVLLFLASRAVSWLRGKETWWMML